MYYKIQPEQIEIHNFSSPSGDMNFLIGSNYIDVNLSRTLTGNFDFIGDLLISGVPIKSFYNSSNFLSGDNSFVFGGSNNQVSGKRNSSLNTEQSQIGGEGNAIINSSFSSIKENSLNNTILGGKFANILQNITGSMILKDGSVSQVENNINNSLSILFEGGNFIKKGGLNIENGDFKLNNFGSGLISGNFNVLGNSYFSNRPTVNGTGVLLIGEATAGGGGGGDATTNTIQTFSGQKTFTAAPIFQTVNNQFSLRTGVDGSTINISAPLITTNCTYTIPNVGANADFILNTGNQTIGGTKNFTTRPTVSGTGVLLVGEAGGGDATTNTAQTFSAIKTFTAAPVFRTSSNQLALRTGVAGNKIDINASTIGGDRVYTLPDVGANADFVLNTGAQTIGGTKNFTTRPTVNGIDVLLVGEGGTVGGGDATTSTPQTFTAVKTFTAAPIFQTVNNQFSLRTGVAGFEIDITAPTIGGNRVYTLPDVGADAEFVMNSGTQTIGGTKTFTAAPVFRTSSNQLTLRTGVAGNRIDINAPTINSNRTYTLPDAGNDAKFVMDTGLANGYVYMSNGAITSVPLAPAGTISPTSRTVTGPGTTYILTVTPQGGIGTWTVTSKPDWVILDKTSGTGTGSITVTVNANAGTQRIGSIIVLEQAHTITQYGALTISNTAAWTPTSAAQSLSPIRTVTASAGDTWSISSNTTWLTVTPTTTTTGTGSPQNFTLTVTENPTPDSRVGTVTIGSQTITVTQAGKPVTVTLSNPSNTVNVAASNTNITVTASLFGAAVNSWSVGALPAWITVTPLFSKAQSTVVNIAWASNTTAGNPERSHNIEFFGANQTAPAVYNLKQYRALALNSSATLEFNRFEGTKTRTVFASDGQPWTASTGGVSWITISVAGGALGSSISTTGNASGSQVVTIKVLANTATNANTRRTFITVAGISFEVIQTTSSA